MSRRPVGHRFLPIGEFYFGADRLRIQTVLGTCVAITVWHPIKRLGGICHYLLPTRGPSRATSPALPGVYADEVMELFDTSIQSAKTSAAEYQVKLFGGGNMFPEHMRTPACDYQTCTDVVRETCASIGCQNIAWGQRLLDSRGYTIVSRDVGGHGSRQITFDVWSGDVWVRRGSPTSGSLSA